MSAHRLLNPRIIALAITLLIGIFLRLPPALFQKPDGPLRSLVVLHPQPASQQLGFDEGLYRDYTDKLIRFGLISYPEIIERYREKQQTLTGSILPPVRFLYIFFAYLWHELFGSETLSCLKNVSAVFSMFTLLLAAIFGARLGGSRYAIGVGALMAFAPTQLHMSHHALVDGFFTFWAMLVLCSLWENLHASRDWRWLALYTVALTATVLTKENAFFVWVAVVVILIANYWLKFGTVTRELLLATVIGPVLGVVLLGMLAGGAAPLIATYHLSVSKNYELKYAKEARVVLFSLHRRELPRHVQHQIRNEPALRKYVGLAIACPRLQRITGGDWVRRTTMAQHRVICHCWLNLRSRDAQLRRHGRGVSALRTSQSRTHAWLKDSKIAGESKVTGNS